MPTSEEVHLLFAELTQDEELWSTREELLNSHGYELRPRLRQGWTPSWVTTGKSPLDSEDGESLVTSLVDAYTEDGKRVIIKEVERGDEESRIARMLSSEPLKDDPKNHCVPVLDVFDDPADDSKSFLVMPLPRAADHPSFDHVKEVVDFVDQLLDGLVFLHQNGVAHRDCVRANLMMDADAMYPEGFHPVRKMYEADYSGYATPLTRSAAGVKYYFIDFGISVHIPESAYPRLVTGNLGRDQTPPELSTAVPCDPFKLDV